MVNFSINNNDFLVREESKRICCLFFEGIEKQIVSIKSLDFIILSEQLSDF